MSYGISIALSELIALQRFVGKSASQSKGGGTQSGNYFSKFRGRGMDIAEVRNYQAGDDIRHMEWRVTARTGRPHIKIYQEERERPVVILNDFNPSMYFGTRQAFKSVLAAKLAALVAWTAIRRGDRVGGLIAGLDKDDAFPPHGRDKTILPWLAKLSEYTLYAEDKRVGFSAGRPFSDMLLRLRRVVRPGSIVVLLSDFYQLDDETEKHLQFIAQHNEVIAYHICDPLELSLPKVDKYPFSNGQEIRLVNAHSASVRQAYVEGMTEKNLLLRQLLLRTKVQYVLCSVEQDLPQLVKQTFSGGRRGR